MTVSVLIILLRIGVIRIQLRALRRSVQYVLGVLDSCYWHYMHAIQNAAKNGAISFPSLRGKL